MNDRFYKKLSFFANLSLALALAMLTLIILNFFNPMWGFLSTTYSKIVLAASGIVSSISAGFGIALVCKRNRKLEAKRNHARREARESYYEQE